MYTLFSFVSWGCHHNRSSTLPNAYTKLLERWGGKQMANRWQEMPQHLHWRKKKKKNRTAEVGGNTGMALLVEAAIVWVHMLKTVLLEQKRRKVVVWVLGWWPRLWCIFSGCLIFSTFLQGEEMMSHQVTAVGSSVVLLAMEERLG